MIEDELAGPDGNVIKDEPARQDRNEIEDVPAGLDVDVNKDKPAGLDGKRSRTSQQSRTIRARTTTTPTC